MDLKELIQFFGKLELGQLIAMGVMMWFFYSRLDSKIEKLSGETRTEIKGIREEIKQQSERSDKLYEMFLTNQRNMDQRFYDLLKDQKSPKTNP